MGRGSIVVGLVAVTAVVGLTMATPSAAGTREGPEGSDAAGGARAVVSSVRIGPEGTVVATQKDVPVTVGTTATGEKPAEAAPKPAVKLDPRLAALAKQPGAAGDRQRVILTFQEDQKLPRLPDPDPALPRTAPGNAQLQSQANALVNGVVARRRPGYQALSAELARQDVSTLDTYWLIKGMVVDAPVSALPVLAQRRDVTYVEPVATGARPPADSDPNNDEADARALMHTDPFFGRPGGYIGILDTGVRATHTLFNPPRPWIREDLTNTTSPNPDDDCWNHGTSTLGVITGNANLGDDFRGITNLTVDSFKVYPSGRDALGNCNGLDADAAVRGFQRAVAVLDRVIVAEMQAVGTETSAISAAADGAYDAGAVVIAANGNNGPGAGTVNVPAVAQKALGIGAVDLATQTTPSYQSLGPAPDGRTKPDIQAPTNVETASNASDTATRVFTGTSAATPHAAGAAALLRNYLRDAGSNGDPGQINALMIASGNRTTSFENTHGAGLISLEPQGVFWWSDVTIGHHSVLSIPAVDAAGPGNHPFSVAIWWAEQPATHNDIDVSLVDPSGVVRASSTSVSGVFERLSLSGPVAPGRWTVRITGFNVPTGSQLVHAAWTF